MALKTTRKGKRPAEKRSSKQAGDKSWNIQQLTVLDLPVLLLLLLTEIKSAYENFNQSLDRESDKAIDERESELESKETLDMLELPPEKESERRIEHVILSTSM